MARYDARTALVVVDVQNDFAHPEGSLRVAGAEEAIAAVNEEIASALAAGAFVVCSQDWHPERTPHFERDGGIWPVHCVAGSWGARLHDALDAPADAPRVRKGAGGEDGYSAFTVRDPAGGGETPTALASLLRERGAERVVVVGLATDYCVLETALDARRLGFATVVVERAIAAVGLAPGDGERALAAMREAGARVE